MSDITEDAIKVLDTLITHPARIKERLIDALVRTELLNPDNSEIPIDLREDYDYLVRKLTQDNNSSYGDGNIARAINGVSEDEASRIAGELKNFINQILTPYYKSFGD